jgi:hypothetical protein
LRSKKNFAQRRHDNIKNAARGEKFGSRAMASKADAIDRAIRTKFRLRSARSLAREILFAIQANSDKFFSALVLIAK